MSSSNLLIEENFNLSMFNTMGLHAYALYFTSATSVSELKDALAYAKDHKLKYLVLGGGSNVLFKKDFEGLIIHNRINGIRIEEEADSILIHASGGENWHTLVQFCVSKNFGGIENMSLIPGSVGAAPMQNIGAYGAELKDVFVQLTAINVENGEERTFNKDECKFGYRDSVFKNQLKGQYIITEVTLRLSKNPEVNTTYKALSDYLLEHNISDPAIKDVSEAVIKVRQSKLPDPAEIGNTGSFFKNPVISTDQFDLLKEEFEDIPGYRISDNETKVPAGWLIEKAGWKGYRKGDAGVHSKQALVLVNYGNATGEELWELAMNIKDSVQSKFRIELNPEVNIIE